MQRKSVGLVDQVLKMGQCCWWTKAPEGHNEGFDDTDARGLKVSNLQYQNLLLVCVSFVDQM